MAMSSSTANWHWKNKNVTPWAKTWFETELTALSHSENGSEVKVTQVTEMDGDCELGQRKSKLITIYDCKVVLSWSGEDQEGTKAEGSLTIPEVSHEQSDGLSDYVYEWSLTSSSSPAVDALYTLARAKLPSLLEGRLNVFRTAMLDAHGKDLTVTGTPNTTNPGTPAPASSGTPLSKPVSAKDVTKGITNATTVTVDASFMASAADLFDLLTDEKKIPAWSHAPAQSQAAVGSPFSLFGGGVTGKYTELQKPTKIVSTWLLQSPSWPAGHEGQLTTTLDQQSDSTKVVFKLAGVPRGMEDEIRKNIEGYYVRGFQSIGYVRIFPTPPSQSSSAHVKRQSNGNPSSWVIPCVFAFLAFSATIASRYL